VTACVIRPARPGDEPGAYHVCLKTGDFGRDAEALYAEDPDALGRVFVGPYLEFEPKLSLILEDAGGICGYALAAFDSARFYARYDAQWRPGLCQRFPEPRGESSAWTPVQRVHHSYHHPDFYCPEPYDWYPSHLHIDLLPRAQGRGYGRQMIERIMDALAQRGSAGVHLGVSELNTRAFRFYQHLGFQELTRVGAEADCCIYMGRRIQEQ
jgi:ribosomal protein S18 acetylase RimI-like enzyme